MPMWASTSSEKIGSQVMLDFWLISRIEDGDPDGTRPPRSTRSTSDSSRCDFLCLAEPHLTAECAIAFVGRWRTS